MASSSASAPHGRTRRRFLCASLAAVAIALAACRTDDGATVAPVAPAAPAPTWRVACDFDNPPFASLDESGRPVGRDVEMTQILARRLGVELEWVQLPFEELLPAVEAARVDAVVATVGITPERSARVLFSRPYYETTIAVVVRRGPGEPQKLADLAHGTVHAGVGTTSERAVVERLGRDVLFSGSKDGESGVALLLGLATDALAMDEPNAAALLRSRPEELRILRESLARERYAIAVNKRSWRMLARIDGELRAMANEGELTRLDTDYGVAEAVRR
jgi:polar amino acid transport system substrate-binding protein